MNDIARLVHLAVQATTNRDKMCPPLDMPIWVGRLVDGGRGLIGGSVPRPPLMEPDASIKGNGKSFAQTCSEDTKTAGHAAGTVNASRGSSVAR
jgi:hypothetical protein